MKLRIQTPWRVLVYCLAASWVGYYATVYFGSFFFAVKSVGADGVTNVSADPVRSAVFHAVLFLAVLLVGGLWAFRSMTRAEIAVSAGIMTAVYLAAVLVQLYAPEFPLPLSVTLTKLQNWTASLASLLTRLTNQPAVSALIGCFAPLLLIPFGRKTAGGNA